MIEDEPRDRALQALLPLDGRSGPAPRLSEQRQAALIDAALDQWHAPAPKVSPIWRTLAIAAAALLICAAGAQAWFAWRAARQTPAKSLPRSSAPVHAPAIEQPSPVSAPATHDEAPPARATKPNETDPLLRANRLRAEGRYRDAVAAYQRVIRSEGDVPAYVARVAAASIELEHLHDPRAARELYRAAAKQATPATLDLEIQRGIAEACRQLGDAAGERAALSTLIARHAQTRAAEQARTRLQALPAP